MKEKFCKKNRSGEIMTLRHKKNGKRRRINLAGRLLVVLLPILFLTGFAEAEVVAKQSGSTKSKLGSDYRKQKKGDGSISRSTLLPVVTAFADSYAARLTQSNMILQNRLKNNADRFAVHNMMVQSIATAYDISTAPNSVTAILDMTVMVTLQRMAWEEFWYPKRLGDPAQGHLKVLRQLEKEIWTIAAKFLTPEQQQDLRNLILKWRKSNPDQQIVFSVRFSLFRDEMGEGSKDPKGLFSGITKAANAAEELRVLGERYRFLLTRMQMMLNPQLQLAYLQMVSQPEVNQLIKDANRLTSSFELVAESASRLPETAKNIIKEAGAESEQFRKLVEEMQQMLTVGNELIFNTKKTLELIDSLVARFDPIREKKQGAKPIDIGEYRDAAKEFTETAHEINLMIQSLDLLLANQIESNQRLGLLDAVGKIGQEGEDFIDHIFYRAITFLMLLLLGIILASLIYRYVSIKMFDTSLKQKSL